MSILIGLLTAFVTVVGICLFMAVLCRTIFCVWNGVFSFGTKKVGWKDFGKSITIFEINDVHFINNGNNFYVNTERDLGYGQYYDGNVYVSYYYTSTGREISSDQFYKTLTTPVAQNGFSMLY